MTSSTISINFFEILPPAIIVNIFRKSCSLPIDRYIDRNGRQMEKVNLFYNLNIDTRYNVVHDIRIKKLSTKVISYVFNYTGNVNQNDYEYAVPRLWKKHLVDFISNNDFGPVNPLDINSPPLTSYLSIIGGVNSSSPGNPTYIASANFIIIIISLYIRRHNLLEQSTYNIQKLRDGEKITTKYFAADKPISELFTPYLTKLPTVDINNITHQDIVNFLRLMFESERFTQSEIDAVNYQMMTNMPIDEREAFDQVSRTMYEFTKNIYRNAKVYYRNRWRGVPPTERTDRPPIRRYTYNINKVITDIETYVGHKLSPETLAVIATTNEFNICRDADKILKAMLIYPQYYLTNK